MQKKTRTYDRNEKMMKREKRCPKVQEFGTSAERLFEQRNTNVRGKRLVKRFEKCVDLRPAAAGLAACVFFYAALPAQAGFVEEFYEETTKMTNVSQAGIMQAGALNVVTGGGFVYRTPRKSFVPFSVTPPSLKAGCGGIDVFLGAFAIPSREEFVSFLKSVGTALPGLAFQLALQTMAPDLNEQVARYSDLIRSYTNRYTDSCSAAQALLEDTGAAAHLQNLVHKAKNGLRASGEVADQSEADRSVRDDGEKAIESAPVRKDSGGTIVDAPEINLTWALLTSGRLGKTGYDATSLREVMMTLVGTTVFKKSGSGEDAVIEARHYAGTDLLPVLFGEVRGNASFERLHCTDAKTCLTIESKAVSDLSLVDKLKGAARHYSDALESRNAALVTDEELVLLGASTGVPLIRILNLAALSRYRGIADDLINIYVEAAAYEMLASAVHALALDIRTTLASSAAASISSEHVAHVQALEKRVGEIEAALNARESRVMQAMVRASSLVTQLEHIERSLTAAEGLALRQVLPASAGN